MSKAVAAAAELAGAAGLGAIAFLNPSILATPGYIKAMAALSLGGVSSVASVVADALTGNRGVQITDRRPAANRNIVYGTQMIGGNLIYESVTGHQYNQVIVIAGHSIHSIQGIYLDGRKVYFTGSGGGWSVRNGVGFGGNADGNDHLLPDGTGHYNFGGKVYVEARYGDQVAGDYISGLTANDSAWGPKNGDTPSLVGCAYIYLKCTAGSMFPQRPEVKILVNGKDDILDPRTGTTGFTNNAALVFADVVRDTKFGLGDPNINLEQLIAAANLCDEQVPVAALSGATESRYCCDYSYDTGTPPGDAMQTMLTGMAGRVSYVGGEWFVFPGAYRGPTLSFDTSHLTDTVQWNPYRSVRDLPNRITGTHISAEYPFSVAGNYYQYHQQEVQNNFDLKFTQSSYPYYAQDQLHGYPTDTYLTEDGGRQKPMDLPLPSVLSLTQCQRVAKINLLRARAAQGSGTLEMTLAAYKLTPCDTFNMTCSQLGWTNKVLEVVGTSLHTVKMQTDDGEANALKYTVNVQETSTSIYAWSTVEELTVYASPASPSQTPLIPAPPTDMVLTSGPNTAITTSDGLLIAVLQVTWDTPLDNMAVGIQIQYAITGTGAWTSSPQVDISVNVGLITTVSAGASYDVRIRTVRSNGVVSDWVEQDNFLVPMLEGNLGTLAASLTSTQGFTGKWWTISSASDVPSSAGDLARPVAFKTSGGNINYWLDAGGVSYNYAGVTKLNQSNVGVVTTFLYARFTGFFTAPATGSYTFGVNGDDGSRLTINNVLLYDTLHSGHGSNADRAYTESATITLTAGQQYQIVLEYMNQAGSGVVQFLFQLPGSSTISLVDLGATYTSAGNTTYADGSTVQTLQPATPGADKTTDQAIVYAGTSGNLIANGDFLLRNIDGWRGGSYNSTYNAIIVPANDGGGVFSPTFAVQPGNKYRFTWKGWATSSDPQQTYLRVVYGDTYSPNLSGGIVGYQDFIDSGSIAVNDTNATYTYDWVAPANIRYALLAMYSTANPVLAFTHVSAQDYAAAAQWGADQTSSNTSADTSAVSGVPSYVIANVVPSGFKVILNTGNRTYSIQAI